MKTIAKYAVAAMIASGAALATSAPAQADVGFSIGINAGPSYYGYNYGRSCRWYYNRGYPAPSRCYRDFIGFYGPGVYLHDGFVFRSRDHYNNHWRDRDDWRHWRSHNWSRANWHHDRDRHHNHDRHHHDH